MPKKLTNSQVNRYGLYMLTSVMASMVQMTYLTIFMTDIIAIPVGIVASLLLVARIIDFFIGVACGGFIEKIHLPWGKYRSWLLIGRWVNLIGLVCSFLDTSAFPLAIRLVIAFLGYFFVNASMGFMTTAYYGLGPALAGANMEDRFRLSTRGAQLMCVANILTSIAVIPIVTWLTPRVGGNAYLIVAVVFSLPFLWGCKTVSDLCKDCDPNERMDIGTAGPTVTIGDMVNSVIQNKQLLVLFLAYTIYYIGMFTVSGLGTYYFTYIVGDFMKMSLSMTITMITGFLASLVVPKIGGKLGKKKSLVVALFIYAASFMCIYFIAGNTWYLYTLFGAIGGAAIYLFSAFGANYFVDCGEYYLYKTGIDTRIIAVNMFSVPMKIGMALGGAVATFGLTLIGFQAGMAVDPVFQNHFMILVAVIPACMVVVGALIVLLGYKITDADAAMYAAENAKKYNSQQ